MDCKIIFLGGIHGTGKGFVSDKLCVGLSIDYLSASELIKWDDISIDSKNKAVEDIPNTQKLLIKALKEKCVKDKTYLLDGHYCLLDSNQKPKRIEFDIFSEICPVMLLIITAEPEIIKQRLADRDNRNYDISLIEEMQSVEKNYAEEISLKLNTPLYFINDININETINLIKCQL